MGNSGSIPDWAIELIMASVAEGKFSVRIKGLSDMDAWRLREEGLYVVEEKDGYLFSWADSTRFLGRRLKIETQAVCDDLHVRERQILTRKFQQLQDRVKQLEEQLAAKTADSVGTK